MLRTHRDDDLVRIGPYSPARQDLSADLFDQGGIVMSDEIRGPAADVQHRERLDAAFAPFCGREQFLVELAIYEGEWHILPLAGLDNVPQLARMEAQAFVPVHCCLARRSGLRFEPAIENAVADKMATALA